MLLGDAERGAPPGEVEAAQLLGTPRKPLLDKGQVAKKKDKSGLKEHLGKGCGRRNPEPTPGKGCAWHNTRGHAHRHRRPRRSPER